MQQKLHSLNPLWSSRSPHNLHGLVVPGVDLEVGPMCNLRRFAAASLMYQRLEKRP